MAGAGNSAIGREVPAASRPRVRLYVPRQHGAWALLAVPLALGVAAGHPRPAHVLLIAAAIAGYLAVATLQSAAAARSSIARFQASIWVYGGIAAICAVVLAVANPPIVLAALVVVPSVAVAVLLGRARRSRELIGSLTQTAQAIVLAPVAAFLAGVGEPDLLARVALVAAVYLVGSVLVVRSVIRERGNAGFALSSVALHVVAIGVAALTLPVAYALLFAGLAARAAALPLIQRQRAAAGRTLKPVFVGLEELAAGIAVVAVALTVGL